MSSNSDLTPLGSLCVGSLSSVCSISICQPANAIKNHIMTGKGFPRPSFALYRGLRVNLMCDQTNQPLAFLINNYYYNTFLNGKQATVGEKITGGVISGTLISPLLSFCERIMIIQQLHPDPVTKKGLSIVQVIKKIKESEGIKGFTKGVIPTAGRESINLTCFFGLQKTIEEELKKKLNNKEKASAIAFIASGTIAGALTSPLDLIKTLTQSELDGTKGGYFKKLKASLIKELGPNIPSSFLKSCLARMVLMSGLLGTLGIVSTHIPKLLPKTLFKNPENQG